MNDKEFDEIWEEQFSQICSEADDCERCAVSKACAETTLKHMGLL